MMNIRPLVAGLFGLAMVFTGFSDPIAEATYARLFDRAQALMPGLATVEQDLLKTGAWEIIGGRQIAEAGAIVVQARTNALEIVWKGAFLRALPALSLTVGVQAAGPVRVMLSGFYTDRFNRLSDWMPVAPDAERPLTFSVKGNDLGGIKLVVEGKDLSGKTIRFKDIKLSADFYEGCFRREVTIPAGDIWEAVAEVGNMTTLYINGQRVDDETIILPRPYQEGGNMYHSKRVPLKARLKPGRNVLGMSVMRSNGLPAAYLRGSVIMASGERIVLDSGTNWVWRNEAPENWFTADVDASGWPAIRQAEVKDGYYSLLAARVREAFATPVSGIGLSYRPRGDMPCYDGLIKLRNPVDKKFFFDENQPFQLEAAIPPGLRDGQPEWGWEISRYAADGTFSETAHGLVKEFKPEGDSLTAGLPSMNLERGIYVLTSRLRVHGEIVEEREPEPLVVTGRVKMPESAGDTLEQGMDLTLEKVVDFTDPRDPHPWFETDYKGPIPPGIEWGSNYYHTVAEPLIVQRNGLTYRTTRPVARAQFSYCVDFAHPGDWYLLVLEYPDDAERWIGVSCNAASRDKPIRKGVELSGGSSKCGPAIWIGGKYPNTGKMLEMKWIYRPDPGSHAINVMSLMQDTEAAAARLRIYHVAGRLPELDTGSLPEDEQRRFGMLVERTYPWEAGIYNAFSAFAPGAVPNTQRSSMGAGKISRNAVVEACAQLWLLEDAASHFAEYMRFAGQNLHTMGCLQYHDGNTASQFITGDPRLHDNPRNMLARVLQANGLRFYASVEFYTTAARDAAEQKAEWFFAGRAGDGGPVPLRGSGWGGYNFLHPDIERDMLEVARQLAEEFKHQPHFLGINWTAYFGGSWLPNYRASSPDPLDLGYGDFTIGLFEKETGINVPGGSEQSSVSSEQSSVSSEQSSAGTGTHKREPGTVNNESAKYEQRYQFLTSAEMRPRWLAWRAQKMFQFFEKVNRVIRAVRPDLETVAGCYLNYDHIKEWKDQDIPFQTYLDQWGWNPETFKDKENIWLMPWLPLAARYQPSSRRMDYAMAWQGNHDPEFYRPFADFGQRALMLCAGWIEVERVAGNFPYREGWPRPYQQTMMAQQREELAMEPYTQALIGFDPQMVMMGFTDVSPYIGVEGMQRKFARVLRRLPWDRFEPVLDTGFDSNFAIRALREGDDYLFYVANPGYWPIKGTVTLEGAAQVADLVSGKVVALRAGVMDVDLEPFGIAAFRASVSGIPHPVSNIPKIAITSWTTAPVGDADLQHLRQIVDRAKAAAVKPHVKGFLGPADYGTLTGTVAAVEQALAEQRPARAWAAVTDAFFWTILFQKIPELPDAADLVKPRTLVVGRGAAPVIDGILDDYVWKGSAQYAKPSGPFVTAAKEYSAVQTMVRAARAGDGLFMAFECYDPEPDEIRGTTDRGNVDQTLWGSQDDWVAFCMMPKNETNHYRFAVSANGAKYAERNGMGGAGAGPAERYAPDWQAAVRRNKQGWVVEIGMDRREVFGEKARGGDLRMNFYRVYRFNRHPVSSWTYNPGDWRSTEHMGTVLHKAPGK